MQPEEAGWHSEAFAILNTKFSNTELKMRHITIHSMVRMPALVAACASKPRCSSRIHSRCQVKNRQRGDPFPLIAHAEDLRYRGALKRDIRAGLLNGMCTIRRESFQHIDDPLPLRCLGGDCTSSAANANHRDDDNCHEILRFAIPGFQTFCPLLLAGGDLA